MKVRVGIVGHRGYSGAELVRILGRHGTVEPVLLEHRTDAGEPRAKDIADKTPNTIPCTPEAVKAAGLAAVMLATPLEVSLALVPAMVATGAKVIDLSGGFRLKTPAAHQLWYGGEHPAPELLAEAAYGLPEFYRDQIRPARLVANPGCYPTAANLALQPLLQAGVIARDYGVVCDAKSGVSGAGRKPSLATSFCEVTENFSAYGVLDHRHVPEVLMNSGLRNDEFSFTAQLLPVQRGILETIYFRGAGVKSATELIEIYRERYRDEPFLRVRTGRLPDLRGVAHTNYCDLGVVFDAGTGRAVVVSAIDNLLKGAAGQAVQNLNLILGFPETAGLL